MLRVLLITNAPTPYRIPLFNAMDKMFFKNGFALKVLFCASGYARRKWENPLREANFEYSILRSLKIRLDKEAYILLPINLFKFLLKEKPALVISAGFSTATIFVYLFYLITKRPYIIWSGEVEGGHQSVIRSSMRKILANKASAFVAYGTRAGKYLESLNCKKPIFYGWNTVDTAYFSRKAKDLKAQKDRIIKEFQLSQDKIHILGVSYLVKRKGFENLLKALETIRKNNKNFSLHLIGDGPEREKLEGLVKEFHLNDHVRFWGYNQKEELPKFLAISDIFVFPSFIDIWGLVLNEAMASGLPVVASKYAGATYDLVTDGVNGFVIDPYNIEEMAEKILVLINNPELRKHIGEMARIIIEERFTVEHSAKAFVDAINYVLRIDKLCIR